MLKFQWKNRIKLNWWLFYVTLVIVLLPSYPVDAGLPEKINGIYLPPYFCERIITETIHYAALAQLNAVVLHVKDPRGKIYWRSKHPVAREIGAIHRGVPIERTVKRLKSKGIWTIAKIDIFEDSLLVKKYCDIGILDKYTGKLWTDKKGLNWVNPYDRRAWDYNIALCKELIEIGFDEIQFDYTRFPSDGNLSRIWYPTVIYGLTKAQCIGEFLKNAYSELKPLNITISIDVFGLTAWKKEDFGVGQVLEEISPHVDVICPMLYPSHFPDNFLGWEKPGHYPRQILELSVKSLKKRTDKKIRPWIQGFWYKPDKIIAQIEGILSAGTSSWTVWNPSGRYGMTYRALEIKLDTIFPDTRFYPSLGELHNTNDRIIKGNFRIINFTDYRKGYTILSLEESKGGYKSFYSTPVDTINTLDEAIMDRILLCRDIPFGRMTNKSAKKGLISNLFCTDLNIKPRRIRAVPVYIDWLNSCRFSFSFPEKRLDHYLSITENMNKKVKRSSPEEMTCLVIPIKHLNEMLQYWGSNSLFIPSRQYPPGYVAEPENFFLAIPDIVN